MKQDECSCPGIFCVPRRKNVTATAVRMLRALLEEGLRTKVSEMRRDDYRKRLEEEVYVIESTNNVDYFLIQWDMVAEARRRGIATGVGRGSAGGSLVSYLLGITSIDPVAYDLLFSRFLVPERCGLNWVEEITVLGEDVSVEAREQLCGDYDRRAELPVRPGCAVLGGARREDDESLCRPAPGRGRYPL